MKEHNKNLNLYYRVFLLICFTFLIFTLPTTENEHYNKAINEIISLNRILENDLANIPERLTNSYVIDALNFSRAFNGNLLTKEVEIDISEYSHTTFGSKQALQNMGRLDDIYRFFRRNELFNEFQSRKDLFDEALLDWISKSEKREIEMKSAKRFKLRKMTFTRIDNNEMSESYIPNLAHLSVEGILEVWPNKYWPLETTIYGYTIEMIIPGGIQDYIEFKDSLYPKELLDGTALIKQDFLGGSIQETLFPNLKLVWDEIKGMDIESATDHLDAKIFKTQYSNDFSIFGVKVDRRFGTIIGPLGAFLAITFLFVQLRQIQRIQNQIDFKVEEVLWIPFFPGKLSLIISTGSLVLLPFLAAIVFLRYFPSVSGWDFLGIVFFILSAGVGMLCVKSIIDIRRINTKFNNGIYSTH